MTHQEIIAMACGVELPEPELPQGQMPVDWDICYYTADQLRDYGDRRAAAERELITRFLESHAVIAVGGTIAGEIRGRGQQ